MTERWEIPGWAGPVAGITSTSPEYTHARTHIESITTQMRALDTQQGLTPSQAHSTADAAVDTDTAAVSGAGQGGGKGDKDVVHKAVHGGAQGEGEGDKAAMRRAAKRARFQSKSERERSHWPEGARDQYALLASQRAGASYDLMGKVRCVHTHTHMCTHTHTHSDRQPHTHSVCAHAQMPKRIQTGTHLRSHAQSADFDQFMPYVLYRYKPATRHTA